MQRRVAAGELHPMQAKKDLAHTVTREFHSAEEADSAAANWSLQFQSRGVADDLPLVPVSLAAEGLLTEAGDVRVAKLLQLCGLAASAGEGTRKLAEGAVSVRNERVTAKTLPVGDLKDQPVLRLGRKAIRLQLETKVI
jgi:tyrosyl-tRNA synthetase